MITLTLDDLRTATEALQSALERQDAYGGNNPNKHQTAVRLARERLDEVTQSLKAVGLLVRTEHETLEAKLHLAFPNTVSKTAVEYEGARYERWHSPATRSLSGHPMTWAKGWTRLEP